MELGFKMKPLIETNSSFEYKGHRCVIKQITLGASWLCGYVEVKEGHPFHGVSEENIHFNGTEITFSGELEDSKYYLGFDCAHSDDLKKEDDSKLLRLPKLCADYVLDFEKAERLCIELADFIDEQSSNIKPI